MYDIERINKMVRDIEMYFSELKSIGLTEENINSPEKFFSSSMIMFGILNRTLDLAQEIIAKNEWGMPSAYEEYFEMLGGKGIVDKNLSDELKRLVKDRNLFAHEYYNMERKKVISISKRIYFVKDFIERVKQVVKKNEKA